MRDANNNRSAYVYDGFDRLCRLYFPAAAMNANQANTGGVAESALTCSSGGTNPDYEGYGYDANGNMVSRRVRSGETIGGEKRSAMYPQCIPALSAPTHPAPTH